MQLPVTVNQMANPYPQEQYPNSNSPPFNSLPSLSLASPDLPKPTRSVRGTKRKSPPIQDPPPHLHHPHHPPSIPQPFPTNYNLSDYQPQDGVDGGRHSPPESGAAAAPGQAGVASGGRQLSTSKRAEQNRKAQRAFRERRDAHVRALESRSQMLDAAMASAEEANRRWEECRALCESLRVENAGLRAALASLQQQQQGNIHPSLMAPNQTAPPHERRVRHKGHNDREESGSPHPEEDGRTRSRSIDSALSGDKQ